MRPDRTFRRLALWFGLMALCGSAHAASFIVEIKEADTAKPVAGAKIVLTTGAKSLLGTSGGDGLCPFDAPITNNTRLDVEKDGWCPMRWDISATPPSKEPARFAFPLLRAGMIGGSVVDETQAPVPRVQIYVNFPQRLLGPHIPVEDLAVVTDHSGRWEADFVPEKVGLIHIDLVGADYQWDGQQPSQADLRSSKAVLNVKSMTGLRGRVVDPSGKPVAGAMVYRGREWGIMSFDQETTTAKTGPDGAFRFEAQDEGKAQLAAIAPAYGGAIKTVDVTRGMAPVELRLTAPQTRRFRVTDLKGQPIVKMNVKVSDWDTFREPPWRFTTDAEGRFAFTNAPEGELKMDFSAPGHFGLMMRPVAATEDEQLIQLGPPLRLHGKVTDAKTGQPIPEFRVTPGWPNQVFINGAVTNQGGDWAQYQTKSFHHGDYDWTFTQHVIAGTEKPYDFLLKVEADGFAPAISRVIKTTEADVECDFALEAPKYTVGTLRFSDGSPAANTTIYLEQNNRYIPFHNGVMGENYQRIKTIKTDGQGHFQWMQQEDATGFLAWHERGFVEFTPEDLEQSNVITLARWGAVRGTLWRGDHVAAHEKVALTRNPKVVKKNGGVISMRPGPFYEYETQTDDQGNFRFDKVPPGEVGVCRVEPIVRPNRYGMPIGEVWAGCRLAVVQVPEGGVAEVKAGGIGRVVKGRVISTNDFALCMLNLTPMLPPVPYPDGLDDAAKQKWVAQWFWSEAAAKFRIWYGGTPQVVSFRQFPGSWQVSVTKDGSFQIDDVPPGDYTLNASFRDPTAFIPGVRFRPFNSRNNMGLISYRFTMPEGDNLPAQAPLDIGEFGATPAGPGVKVDPAEPTSHHPVTVALGADHTTVRPGSFFDAVVCARIAEGHHIYSPFGAHTNTFTPTSVKLTLPHGIEAASDWVFPTVTRTKDGALIYQDSARFRQTLKVRADATAGPVTIKGELRCQACNDQLCFPPETLPFSMTVTIEPPAKGTP